jgi:starch synthase (maltosyl-transferring)
MYPGPGERLLRFVGDHIRFTLRGSENRPLPPGFRGLLRTDLGRAALVRTEVIQAYAGKLPIAGASMRDIPLKQNGSEWFLDLALTEVGFFKAKAYAADATGRQYWPDGPDTGITVHPDMYRTGNTIYCAFVRMFGETRSSATTRNEEIEAQLAKLDKLGYTAIPPSGKLRDVLRQLPHIIDVLGCRVLHLLPVNPTPTTYARFGRFGSPYASQDLTAVDPALVEFDRRTTGIDQFRELTYATHLKGARVFLDIVTNHTGWGSPLQENHPEWFLRDKQGNFISPGAWGVTWEDLVELDHRSSAPWDCLAEVFLTWCRRGVDGFRCDAGYKVPMAAWRYITARVRNEFPETIFLLEGLGGSWEATENLLTDGGMQWAYSELFQNYSGSQVAHYLDYALRQSQRVGLYVHYSETHDNDRLARRGRLWSLLRNRLCGLTSTGGGYGFTCGVEWLASERINVHSSRGMSWDSSDNLVAELSELNKLLRDHPCFFDDARLTRLSPLDSHVYALRRDSAEGSDHLLILANTDLDHSQTLVLEKAVYHEMGGPREDMLGLSSLSVKPLADGNVAFSVAPGACHCLSAQRQPRGLSGDLYRRKRACGAWAFTALSEVLAIEELGDSPWGALAEQVEVDPRKFLAALHYLPARLVTPGEREISRAADLASVFFDGATGALFPLVVTWKFLDAWRVTLVPPDHWLLIQDNVPFRASLNGKGDGRSKHVQSVQVRNGHIACFPPRSAASDATLVLERYGPDNQHLESKLRFLSSEPLKSVPALPNPQSDSVLLTNGIGGMARLCADLGRVKSKYDCLLGASLHPSVPVDRHILAKRARVWVTADGFISPLDQQQLIEFAPGPPARWRFLANAGDGRTVEIHLEGDMLDGLNTTVLRFTRPAPAEASGIILPSHCDVRLIVRVDIEDRNFHSETKRNPGADYHFASHCQPLPEQAGFVFNPAPDRALRVFADSGAYHHEAEWSENIPHPVEQSRGQMGSGDAYSPGWFDLPMAHGQSVTLVVSADATAPGSIGLVSHRTKLEEVRGFTARRRAAQENSLRWARLPPDDAFGRQLVLATHSFLVRRDAGKTVIAGYPWFLDWGRDSLICARGLLAAGMYDEVKQLLITFGRFEQNGTLPNVIYGEDASNRDTSDAPLWYGVVCDEAAALSGKKIFDTAVDPAGRTIADVLRSIAAGYLNGTPNGIRVDKESGLVWSPKHFTWMDTNFPAGTPRAGYPVEIQVLWVRLLRQLGRLGLRPAASEPWDKLADRAEASILKYYWIEDAGYLADLLVADPGQPAASAVRDNALRSNCLFALSFGLVTGQRAKRCLEAALNYLVIPGALRSLAPLPVSPPLPIYGNHGGLLNNPPEPYWGRYEGDEDTRRKPAYHNGTAWTWTFPTFCEALAKAWDFQPAAVAAAKAYLGSMDRLLTEGCLGHIPEILDGDAPHQQRGCDAQAWGATEALRVWKLLNSHQPSR